MRKIESAGYIHLTSSREHLLYKVPGTVLSDTEGDTEMNKNGEGVVSRKPSQGSQKDKLIPEAKSSRMSRNWLALQEFKAQ